MIKKIFILLFMLLIAAYLVAAVTTLNGKSDERACLGVDVIVNDSIDRGFISQKEILALLNGKKLSPVGKKMGDINTRLLEEEIGKHPLVESVECYRTPGDKIGIEVTQRVPILRIMADNGESYYLDHKGQIMPVMGSAAHVAVVTGRVSRKFASEELYKFGVFLQENPLWLTQVEQVHVTPAGELEVVPRVGDHILFLGKPGGYEEKFGRLKTFYEKGLNQVGWNKYSRISLEFNNQIICTKKEK